MSLFDTHRIVIGESKETVFQNKDQIFQDGTTPMYRDADGKLWAMSGHSHMGQIGIFSGTCLDDLALQYYICTNFCVGHADYAFSGIRYPDGVKARGSIWPFGLYICPKTHRFFCFFHNEAGWNGKGTGYDCFGLCEKPKLDSDFRHIGLMHSDDEGRNWTFDRWVLTGETPCFTRYYNPNADQLPGQQGPGVSLGAGDFSLYVEPDGEYIYIFYTIIQQDMEKVQWTSCDTYVARTRKRDDGIMGDFVKYYNGAFCEAGNCGKETAIAKNTWHPRVVYSQKYHTYLMSCCRTFTDSPNKLVRHITDVRTSEDLIHWSEPVPVEHNGEHFGNHYIAMVAHDSSLQPNILAGDHFSILSNHNGTDVVRYFAEFAEK